MSDKPKAKEAPVAAPIAEEAAAPRKPSSIMAIVKAVAFVSILVIVQVVGAAMFIPSGEATAELAKQYVAAQHGEAASEESHSGDDHDAHDSGEETAEVELGTFNVTHFNPAANTTLSIDFELYGSVLATDEAEFHHLLEKNKVRVREQVIMTLHAAGAKELSDAGLGLIKRQILEKTNRALGHPMLREVLFSKFNFVERQRARMLEREFRGGRGSCRATAQVQGGTHRVSEDATPINQDEVEKLLAQAREAGPSSPPPPAPPADDPGAALAQSEIEALFAGAASAPAAAPPAAPPKPKPVAAAANAAAKSAEGLLDKAEKALASVDAPPAPLPPGVKAFEFRALGGRPHSTDSATLDLLRDVQLDLKIELGRTHMQLEEVLQLKTGAVVTLDKLAGDPVDVYVNGRLIARGEVLVMNDNFCVRVAELVAGETALA